MKGGWIRKLTAISAAFVAAAAAASLPLDSAAAEFSEHSFSATVDQVLVNRYGGITVNGQLDCSAQVADIFGGAEYIPADTSVFVSKNWTATQYVGRNKVVTASYESGIASVCFTNDPGMYAGDTTPPWSWSTMYAYPVGGTQWVYSSTGKFAAGVVHIALTVSGDLTVGEGDTADQHLFVSFSDPVLRAVKVR